MDQKKDSNLMGWKEVDVGGRHVRILKRRYL